MKLTSRSRKRWFRRMETRGFPMERLEERTLLSVVNEIPLSLTSRPYAITTGADEKLWFLEYNGRPGSYDPATGVETKVTGLTVYGQSAITAGPDGNLWIAYGDDNGGEVTKLSTEGNVLATYNIGVNPTPTSITVGADGALWTAGYDTAFRTADDGSEISAYTTVVSRITTSGEVKNFYTGLWNVTGEAITTGADGAVWVAASSAAIQMMNDAGEIYNELGTSVIVRVAPDGQMKVYDVGAQNATIDSIAAGPDGAVYYAQSFNYQDGAVAPEELIGRITVNADTTIALTKYIITADTSAGTADITGLASGPDGKLWFSEYGTQRVASLDVASGALAEYDVPTSPTVRMTAGPDGNIWFTETTAKRLGYVDLGQLQPTVEISANGTTINAMAGLPFSGPVASFTTNLAGAKPGDFAASINWGDGTVTAGVISLADDGATFVVSGNNTYQAPGSYGVTVTITSPQAATPAVATSAAQVTGGIIASPASVSHVEKESFTAVLATFVGTGPASSYTATIAWGDNTTSAGRIVATSTGYQVVGTHRYATQGAYTAKVTISNGQQIAAVESLVTITDIPLKVTGQTVDGLLPWVAIGIVATFTDDAGLGVQNFTTVINWGDGTTSGGLVVANPLQSGSYVVIGAHIYKKRGTYTTTTTVTNVLEGSVVTALGKAVV